MDSIAHVFSFITEIGNKSWLTIGDTRFTLFRLMGLVVILLLAWWLSNVTERSLHRVAKRSRAGDSSNFYALSRILRYIVWILGSLIGLNYLGFDLASLAIMGGAVGVGIGFGLQNIFSNFVSGIILLVEKTLKVGDFVDLESGVMGKVTEIGMRYTRITTNDLVDVIVPNSEFINGRVTNWSFDERIRRIHIPFGVAYGSDKELVKEAGIAAARTVKGTLEDAGHPIGVWLVNFGDSSLDFELVVWVTSELVFTPGSAKAAYLWALEDQLRARHLEIPFPQRDLHIRSGLPPKGTDASQ